MSEEYRDYSKSPTMNDARAGGLWHVNCGHSVNVFIPGITEERDLNWKQDYTEQYELRQKENYAKRQIKQWERRAEVAKANGDKMAYQTAKNKTKEWREKRKDIAQKRAELDKKQREERFNRPRGKAFPKDVSSLKSQKNENKGQSSGSKKSTTSKKTSSSSTAKKPTKKPVKPNKNNSTERAEEVKKLQQKANSVKDKNTYKRKDYDYKGSKIPSWQTGKANNFLELWNKEVKEGNYAPEMYDAWWHNESGKLLSQMTPEQIHKFIKDNPEYKDALNTYTGGVYTVINGILRGTVDVTKFKKAWQFEEANQAIQAIQGMDKFFQQSGRLGKDSILYRAMDFKGLFGDNASMIDKFKSNPEAFIGMTWTDKGYTSTSPNYNGIRNFLKESDVVLHVYAEEGTKGVYVADYSEYANECEFLLNRNTTFRMVDFQTDENGKLHLMVEILK